MKIVSWNCKAGFNAKKASFIKNYNADLYVIQECLETDLEEIKNIFKNKTFYCDYVENKYGVGLFSDKYKFEVLSEHSKDFRFIVPYKVFNNECEFILFSIWTKDRDENNRKIGYTEQVWNAINYRGYQKYLTKSVILTGDFNSNNYWDKEYISKKQPSHNNIINRLEEYRIVSAYHRHNNCINGNESEPTLLWRMNKDSKYHIDYCFVSDDYVVNEIKIGSIGEWEDSKLSDHCPLIIDLTK